MRRYLRMAVMIFFVLVYGNAAVRAEPRVTAASYVLLEAGSEQILVGVNGKERRPPASTTKILTGITAMDLADTGELTTISPKAERVGEASIYLRAGEIFTLEDLLKGALIKSGNDAAVAIAEQVAGDEGLFIDLANRKAHILGAIDTKFYNPHGLPHHEHLTTAYDLAMITRYSLKNSEFVAIVSTKEAAISSLNSNRKVYLTNTNRLLWSNKEFKGVKTGTTIRAGQCLVSAIESNGRNLIAVVLKSNDRFGDSERLLNWGLENFSLQGLEPTENFWVVEVPNGSPACITVGPAYNVFWSVPKGKAAMIRAELPERILAKVGKGDPLGQLRVSLDGETLAIVPLVAGEDANRVL